MNQDSGSKLTATQNVIRNKFEKAYTNRLVNKHDVNHAMKSLTARRLSSSTTDLESENNDSSLHNLSKTTTTNNSSQLHLVTKINTEEKNHDPNTLCAILRILLTSSPKVGDMNCMRQINTILDELRELEIII